MGLKKLYGRGYHNVKSDDVSRWERAFIAVSTIKKALYQIRVKRYRV